MTIIFWFSNVKQIQESAVDKYTKLQFIEQPNFTYNNKNT